MKYSIDQSAGTLDAIAEPDDHIDVRVYPGVIKGEQNLAVDVNGVTVVRIGKITQEVELVRE
jgi:hypothetical protein